MQIFILFINPPALGSCHFEFVSGTKTNNKINKIVLYFEKYHVFEISRP